MERIIGKILKVSEKEIETKKGKRKKYGVTLGEQLEEGKYIWYNGWGTCKFDEGDTVEIKYEENEYGRQIKEINTYPKEDTNTEQTKQSVINVKTPQIQTEITPLIKIGRKSVISTGSYQNETFEVSIIYPVDEVTPEKIEEIGRLTENQLMKQIKGNWAIDKIDPETKKVVENYVEKILGDGK